MQLYFLFVNLISDILLLWFIFLILSAWDSGAPVIVVGDSPEEDLLVGLGSTGVGCADAVFPSIQSRVSAGMKWIEKQVCELSVDPPSDFDCSGYTLAPKVVDNANTTQTLDGATTTPQFTTITTALYSKQSFLKHNYPGSATLLLATCSLVMLVLVGTVQMARRRRRRRRARQANDNDDDEEHHMLNVQLHRQTYDSIDY
jgi:hypothetical protein